MGNWLGAQGFRRQRRRTVAAIALIAAVAGGCGRTLQPRTSSSIEVKTWGEGAMIDASRAFPVAFWADPCVAPPAVDVGGDSLLVSHWLPYLAKRMNDVAASGGLYDQRLSSSEAGKSVLKSEISNGYYVYRCLPESTARVGREAVRIVKLELESATPTRIGADAGVVVRLAVIAGASRLSYQAQAAGIHWDIEVFQELGRKVMSDPAFWAAVERSF